MTDSIPGLTIRPYPIPARLEDADAADFITMVDVRNRIYREIAGHDDHAMPASELLPAYQPDAYETRLVWLVELDGRAVGRAGLDIPHEAGSQVAYTLVELLRDVWARGIGSVVHDLLERTARAHGRTILQSWVDHPSSDEPRLAPPTGFGSVPRDHAARFLLRHGYALEQVVRSSALDLQLPATWRRVSELLDTALAASAAYEVVSWRLPTPDAFVDGYAWMKSRMSTDAPSADMVSDEEVWDATRLRTLEAGYAGRTVLVTAARRRSDGVLAAFNELAIGADRGGASHQEDTLALREHRGHRLGLLVKCAGLLAWRDIAPDSPRMLTYNAEENRPMLDINEAIGFLPITYEGAWKKVLS